MAAPDPPQPGPYWVPPPAPPPRPAIDPAVLRPRRFWYVVAGLLLLLGAVGAVLLFVVTLDSASGPLERFTAPGTVRVDIGAGEDRSIYVESPEGAGSLGQGVTDGSDLDCTVTGERSGERPELDSPLGTFTITRGETEYEAVLQFAVERGGTYEVGCRVRGVPGRAVPLAVGPRVAVLGFVGRVFGIFASLFGGALLATLIAVLTAVLRHRHRRRLEREAGG